MSKIIKASKHSIMFSNTGKLGLYHDFITEYRRVAFFIVDSMWNKGYSFEEITKDGEIIQKEFNVAKNLLELPKYIDYSRFVIETSLTARALSSLVTQLVGVLKASVEKQRKRLYMLEKLKEDGVCREKRKKLIEKIKTNIPQKPNVSNLNPELSSKCCTLEDSTDSSFDAFLVLKSALKNTKAMYLPVNLHKHSKKLESNGYERMTSFLLSDSYANIRWSKEKPEYKTEGEIVGADQGAKTVLTLSDKQSTMSDIHGHTLDSIMNKMSRLKKGSNAFRRAQEHRKNYINWSIKQLNLDNVKEIKLEDIWSIGYKNPRSRFLSHFTNTLIRDKVIDIGEELGVLVTPQESTYMSQRCSCCGLVRKANRKGKSYTCNYCGKMMDADYNAACNHVANLPEIPYTLREMKLNRGSGFFWNPDGFFEFHSGRSLESLPPVEDICTSNI